MVEYHCNISTQTQLKQNKKHSHIGAQAEVRKNGSAPEQSPGKGSLLVEQQLANSSLIQQHNLQEIILKKIPKRNGQIYIQKCSRHHEYNKKSCKQPKIYINYISQYICYIQYIMMQHYKYIIVYYAIAFHTKEAKYTFFSNAHGSFSKVDHMVGHKISLNKFKKIEIIIKHLPRSQQFETRNQLQGKTEEHSNTWKPNKILLKNEWVTNEIQKEIRKYLQTNVHKTTQNLWGTAKAVLRGKFTLIQAYLKKTKKSQINNLTLRLKELKEQQQSPE